MLLCHSLTAKCRMRKLLLVLMQNRKDTKKLGRLGPCDFEELNVFLTKAKGCMPNVYNNKDVLAIGDLHSDFLVTLGALYLGGAIDDNANWCGHGLLVVQTGDILDRSGRTNEVIDTAQNAREEIDILQYFHALNLQASKFGGGIISLCGNHEMTPFLQSPSTPETRYEGGALHLTGWNGLVEKRKLFQTKTLLAVYFAKFKPLIVQVRSFLFVHGGLTEGVGLGVKEINLAWQNYLLGKTNRLPEEVIDVVMDRRLSDGEISEENCIKRTNQLFQDFGLNPNGAIVVGHTTQKNIPFFCKGRVWLIDVAMGEGFARPNLEVLRVHFSHRGVIVKTIRSIQNGFIQVKTFENGTFMYVDEIKRHTINETE